MSTFVFPGQGSQAKGMGEALFPLFPDLIAEADRVLGYSLKTLCLEDPSNQLNLTQFTQPALYTINHLHYLKKCQDLATQPRYVAGHSLGEYNALLVARVFDFATGLKLVQKRGELMSQARGGGMAAVLGLEANTIADILNQHNLSSICIANYNSCMQIVLSGDRDTLAKAENLILSAGAKRYIPLKVSGAFHSNAMEKAQTEFSEFLKTVNLGIPQISVIANINALPYTNTDVFSNLSQQITHAVKWTQSIEYLLNAGESEFEEIGPGKVLTGLIKRIRMGQ